jgi:hypothetical protein
MLSSTEADNTKARPGKRKPVDSSEPFIDLKKARLKEVCTQPCRVPNRSSTAACYQTKGVQETDWYASHVEAQMS